MRVANALKRLLDLATLDGFFEELGEERSEAIETISMDMGPAFEKSARAEGQESAGRSGRTSACFPTKTRHAASRGHAGRF